MCTYIYLFFVPQPGCDKMYFSVCENSQASYRSENPGSFIRVFPFPVEITQVQELVGAKRGDSNQTRGSRKIKPGVQVQEYVLLLYFGPIPLQR